MNLIAIETSTENCSVALLHRGQITHRTKVAPQKHAELVLVYLDELLTAAQLKKSQIDGIVFGQGPGAFTGVRIAMSVVQGLALALDIPVLPISTLHNMASDIMDSNTSARLKILIANDARMGEVYWASFLADGNQLTRLSEDALNAPEAVEISDFDVCAGSAFAAMIQVNTDALILSEALPSAQNLLVMAPDIFQQEAKNIIDIAPTYIREKVVFN